MAPCNHGCVDIPEAGQAWRMFSYQTLASWPGMSLLAQGQAHCRQDFHSSTQLCRAGNSWITTPLHQTEHLHVSG